MTESEKVLKVMRETENDVKERERRLKALASGWRYPTVREDVNMTATEWAKETYDHGPNED